MDLQEHTILLTVSGSRAYGTHTDTSDLDVRGVMIPPAKYYMGLSRIEQVTDKLLINTSFLGALTDDLRAVALAFGMEGTVFELHKFIRLAADGNPNILDALFCRDEDIIWMSREGLRLRENKERFLTKKCLLTFFGYAKQQLDRIETHRGYLLDKPTKMPTREDFGLPARHNFPQDQVNAAMALVKQKVDSWNIDFLGVDEATKIYVQDQLYKMLTEMSLGLDERHRAAARLLGYDSNFMEFIVQQRNYNAAMSRWNSYQKWLLERNKERAGMESEIGYDCYSADTEFLTSAGWKLYHDVSADDVLATIRPDTGTLVYQAYTDHVCKPHTGTMVRLLGYHYDCRVTSTHQMLVSPARRSKANNFSTAYEDGAASWELVPLETLLAGRRSHYHVRRVVEPSNAPYAVSDAHLILLGAYLSEGCVGKRSAAGKPATLRFSQKEGNRLCKWMAVLQEHFGPHLKEYAYERSEAWRTTPCIEHTWVLRHPVVQQVVEETGVLSHGVHLPAWFRELSQEQARLLLTVMLDGDGTLHGDGAVLYTTSSQLANEVQELCLLSGFLSALWGPYTVANGLSMHQVFMQIDKTASPRHLALRGKSITHEQVVAEPVVCFTVPNGTLVTRRNGKIAIQGNCKHGMHLARLVMACRTIFETGTLCVYNPDPWLRDIRDCKVPFTELQAWYADQKADLASVAAKSSLPDRVPQVWLGDFAEVLVRTHCHV